MRNMKKLFVIVTLLIFSAGLFAQKITVDDAVILAADNNISLKQQKLSLDFLKKQKNASWNSASPSLTLSASYGGSQTGTNEAWSKGEQNKNDPALSATASAFFGNFNQKCQTFL